MFKLAEVSGLVSHRADLLLLGYVVEVVLQGHSSVGLVLVSGPCHGYVGWVDLPFLDGLVSQDELVQFGESHLCRGINVFCNDVLFFLVLLEGLGLLWSKLSQDDSFLHPHLLRVA